MTTEPRRPAPRSDFLERQERRERAKKIWKVLSFVVFAGFAGWRLLTWVRDFGDAPAAMRRGR